MQTKTDSYWKDLKVEGKRVVTISRDKTNDTRTIIFPYEDGKDVYNAIVKVVVKNIGYDGQYHVRIQNNEFAKNVFQVIQRKINQLLQTRVLQMYHKTVIHLKSNC